MQLRIDNIQQSGLGASIACGGAPQQLVNLRPSFVHGFRHGLFGRHLTLISFARDRRFIRASLYFSMIIADLSEIAGRTYPARRRTQNLVGGASPIQATNFSMGNVTLEPNGGQVPWHNQEQEEIYFIVEGTGEMCLGEERATVTSGQAVYIPAGIFHQLTNTGDTPLRMVYCYGPAGDVAHWRQELDGTLPRAGIEAPPLPAGARPQTT
jgi:mannose-6-phosphate isomerase-like protein (cupin superfamily)